MKNKKRLALEIGLVGVIIYLWLKRCKKNNAIAEAKEGANVAPTTEATSQTGECGSATSDCMGTDTSKQGQIGQTVTIAESTANFSGGKGRSVKAQYFR